MTSGSVGEALPDDYSLAQNYPNPFNPSTEISFELSRSANVKLEILNVTGQHVATLVEQELPAGSHTVVWKARGFASGVYLYRMSAGGTTRTMKMVLLK